MHSRELEIIYTRNISQPPCWKLLALERPTRYMQPHQKRGLQKALTRIPQIGFRHGSQAKTLVHGSVDFYTRYFQKNSQMSWEAAEDAGRRFHPFLEQHVPHLVEEMRGLFPSPHLLPALDFMKKIANYDKNKGIADGAEISFASVLALNARTEISMGMMDDGCTALAWKTDKFSVAGQNWDVSLHVLLLLIRKHRRPILTPTAIVGYPPES